MKLSLNMDAIKRGAAAVLGNKKVAEKADALTTLQQAQPQAVEQADPPSAIEDVSVPNGRRQFAAALVAGLNEDTSKLGCDFVDLTPYIFDPADVASFLSDDRTPFSVRVKSILDYLARGAAETQGQAQQQMTLALDATGASVGPFAVAAGTFQGFALEIALSGAQTANPANATLSGLGGTFAKTSLGVWATSPIIITPKQNSVTRFLVIPYVQNVGAKGPAELVISVANPVPVTIAGGAPSGQAFCRILKGRDLDLLAAAIERDFVRALQAVK